MRDTAKTASSLSLLKSLSLYAFLLVLVIFAIGPFAWLLSSALKSDGENIFQYPPQFLPEFPTLENFQKVWTTVPMLQYFINSLVVTGLSVVLNLLFSVLAAYPLARMSFKGEKAIFLIILATMMIPFQVIMIPLYLMMLKMGLNDSMGLVNGWMGLVIPFAVSGFGIFFVRQALVSLPKDLEESAVLDGCNSFQILTRILLPLIGPTLATLSVFTFMANWGEFLWPSIILTQPDHFTLPLGLVQLQGAFSANWRLIASGTILSMIPVLVFFLVLQRYFVSGNLSGAVKG
ncbi:MAG: carbohydrate ABC transporter permease [Cyanobacteria bacterium]|nr:carbohydrate ABC transporter permease [Cyanobacteriota bacterium]